MTIFQVNDEDNLFKPASSCISFGLYGGHLSVDKECFWQQRRDIYSGQIENREEFEGGLGKKGREKGGKEKKKKKEKNP